MPLSAYGEVRVTRQLTSLKQNNQLRCHAVTFHFPETRRTEAADLSKHRHRINASAVYPELHQCFPLTAPGYTTRMRRGNRTAKTSRRASTGMLLGHSLAVAMCCKLCILLFISDSKPI